MPQDAFHIRRIAQELDAFLTGGKINRISQVNKDELTFIVYTGKTTVKLILSASASGARVCLSAYEKEPAPIASNFCMLLRKHLQGAEILSVQQYQAERIIQITLHCTGDFSECDRTLICELMGKYSNIVLVENGIILGALKSTALVDDTHRILFAGAKYEYPVPQDKLSYFDGAGMRSRLQNFLQTRENADEETLACFLFESVSGLALSTAREIVKRANERGLPLWDFLPAFFENEPCNAHLVYKNGVAQDFFAFEVEGGVKMPSLCKAEDEYYSRREYKKAFEDKKRKLENSAKTLRKKAGKRLQDTLDKLRESEKAEENRVKGELLTANLYKIQKGVTGIELENWYDEKGGKIKIALDATLTPSQNAQRYFRAYNKQKRAKEVLTPMQKKEEAEIEYAESILSAIYSAETEEDLQEIHEELTDAGLLRAPKERVGKKQKKPEIPFREYTHNGYTVLVGRNNIQNDRLLKKASPEDIWLHAQKYHSSHVIIVTQGEQVPNETLLFASEICAYYSSGRDSDKIPVDYCKRKFVKKPSKSKAGFVIYTDYKTLLVKPNAHKE
ncbi:MAG: fibronectin/fibrinogen-binding protein [Clostridiales bacterium]|nr:fibronectin/fibrinogen-binding protein [Clostridiales bacterium]